MPTSLLFGARFTSGVWPLEGLNVTFHAGFNSQMGSPQPQILSCGVWSRQNKDEHERHVITTGCGHGWETQLWVCTEAIRIGSARNATRTVKANEHDSWRDQFLPKNTTQSKRVSINNLKPHAWAQTCRRMWRNAKEFFHESWNRFWSRACPGMSIMRSMVKDTCFYNFPKQAGLHLQKRNALLKHSMLGI